MTATDSDVNVKRELVEPKLLDRVTTRKFRRLDKEIQEAERNLQFYSSKIEALKRSRRSLVPINKLSVHILVDIFLLCQTQTDSCSSDENLKPDWEWLTITKVCRHWREVALNYPLLWTTIDYFDDLEKIKTFLRQSQRADLSVAIGNEEKQCDLPMNVLDLVKDEADRVKDLTFSIGDQKDQWSSVQDFLRTNQLSRLKALCLRMNARASRRTSIRLFEHATSEPRVYLETLSLTGVSIPWNHDLLHGLSELSLEKISDSAQPTLSELLYNILRACPNITRLKLDKAGPRPSPSISTKAVFLPLLEYLHIATLKYKLAQDLFARLALPKDVRWYLVCHNFPMNQRTTFIPNLHRNIQPSSQVRVGFIFDELNIEICDHDHDEPIILTLTWDHRPSIAININVVFANIGFIIGRDNWKGTTQLLLEFKHFYAFEGSETEMIKKLDWLNFLEQIPNIQQLSIVFPETSDDKLTTASYFLEAFMNMNTNENTSSPLEFKCPQIQDLSLSFGDFSTSDHEKRTFEHFSKHLKLRELSGQRLRSVGLYDCLGISKKDVKELETVVEVVGWSKY